MSMVANVLVRVAAQRHRAYTQARMIRTAGAVTYCYAYRKSIPTILMVQSAQDRMAVCDENP
jgi:hypothetical protein